MKPSDRGGRVVGFLQQHPVASFEALEKRLKVSRRTVRRALAKHGYYSSCNGNGAYVTLQETPQFTPDGLWVYRKSCFSSHGTLLQTIVALVEASPAGKTLAQLEEQLGTRVHNQVSWLLQDEKLTRAYSGRHVVYLSCDAARATAQQRQRQEQGRPQDAVAARIATDFTRCPEGMRAETVIRLLVQMIASAEQRWQDSLSAFQHSLTLGVGAVQNLPNT